MRRLQSFKFELVPTDRQRRAMQCFAGACRYAFNKALDLQRMRYESGERQLSYPELCKLLTQWRNSSETPWLKEAPVHPLQQVFKNLERAYVNFFAKRAGCPRFKKKGRHDSFRYSDPKEIKLEQSCSRLFLPKLGWVRFRNSRAVVGAVRNVTISQRAGRWFVSVLTLREVTPQTMSGSAIGVDMGIVRFASFSDGSFMEPLNSFKRHEVRQRKAQQALSRKIKYSNNWRKALRRLQCVHARIANARRDYLHKATSSICKNHAIVFIEDLRVKNMTKSPVRGGMAPRSGKRQLNRAILDQGWYSFRRQLEYKLAWSGGSLIAVPPQYTSQICPDCGCKSSCNRRGQGEFVCIACGYKNHADLVAAINVLNRGVQMISSEGRDNARTACVVNGRIGPSSAGTHLCA